jgi:hemerythrin superfamily protein
MADGFAMLEDDHRTIERHFERCGDEPDGSVLRELCEQLTQHAHREEAALYPTLRRYVDGGDDLADRAEAEHAAVATMVAELYDSATPDRVPELVRMLRSTVSEHIRAEESEIFPAMRSCGVEATQLAFDVEQD